MPHRACHLSHTSLNSRSQPFICIGPVCIPWTAFVPIVIWLFKPIYVRLPLEYQEGIKRRWAAINDYMQVAVYDRIGWKAKAKPEKSADPPAGGASVGDALLAQRGGVVGLHSEAEWNAALELTKGSGVPMIVDFTAVWCGPCQKIAPDFARLAKENTSALFVKIDVDELEDVMTEAGVVAMPTFQVYKEGKIADSTTGANVVKLEAMTKKAMA